ncbi:MAG: integrase [Ruminococcaceae bacterium]|nr:integrase [Oscillospiraceae bacterium]
MIYHISMKLQQLFENHLRLEEKSPATIEKYTRDVRAFAAYVNGAPVDKALVLAYKNSLTEQYTATSANSMLAALNSFFRFCGWHELVVKQFRVQRDAFCSESRELTRQEYMRLVTTAEQRGNRRLSLILQTICGTGIRVSELAYVTVEAVKRGEARVNCKGKTRRIFFVPELRKKLLSYIDKFNIDEGAVFRTKHGRPLDRTAIWRAMKSLCTAAKVRATKVFPHNLRHLFARVFYAMQKDIVTLADLLGHASINTTRIYTVTTGETHKRKMKLMKLII